jgi:hypothetical protein
MYSVDVYVPQRMQLTRGFIMGTCGTGGRAGAHGQGGGRAGMPARFLEGASGTSGRLLDLLSDRTWSLGVPARTASDEEGARASHSKARAPPFPPPRGAHPFDEEEGDEEGARQPQHGEVLRIRQEHLLAWGGLGVQAGHLSSALGHTVPWKPGQPPKKPLDGGS